MVAVTRDHGRPCSTAPTLRTAFASLPGLTPNSSNISGAAPTLLGMDSWTELTNPRDLSKIFETPDYAAWKSLRDSENSRYVALCMPRVLSRLPYGAKSEPVEEFAFEEDTDGHKGEKYAWMNAAYAMAANINRSFKLYGWCTSIRGVESGGGVEQVLRCDALEGEHLAAVAADGGRERRGPGVLEADQDGGRAGLHALARRGGVLVAEQAAARALEDDEVVLAVAVEIGDLQAGDRPVELLVDDEHVEHANDAALHQIDEQRDRLAGARRVGRKADDDDVDGSEFQVLCAHCSTSLIRRG